MHPCPQAEIRDKRGLADQRSGSASRTSQARGAFLAHGRKKALSLKDIVQASHRGSRSLCRNIANSMPSSPAHGVVNVAQHSRLRVVSVGGPRRNVVASVSRTVLLVSKCDEMPPIRGLLIFSRDPICFGLVERPLSCSMEVWQVCSWQDEVSFGGISASGMKCQASSLKRLTMPPSAYLMLVLPILLDHAIKQTSRSRSACLPWAKRIRRESTTVTRLGQKSKARITALVMFCLESRDGDYQRNQHPRAEIRR